MNPLDFLIAWCIVSVIVAALWSAWRSFIKGLERDDPLRPRGPWDA